MDAVFKFAATEPRIATGPAAWDRHEDLLNTRDALIDLISGEMMPHGDLPAIRLQGVAESQCCGRSKTRIVKVLLRVPLRVHL